MQTIFLDNDGILVDTEKLYFEASRIVCERHGYELTKERYLECFLRGNAGMGGIFASRGWPVERIAAIRAERDVIHEELLRTRDIALPGIGEGLTTLAVNFSLCMVTSSPRRCLDIIHGRTGFLPHFANIVCEGMVERHKPHPDPYLFAMKVMGVTPEESLAVEDSERGMRAALDAGLRCIVIPRELTRHQDFSGAAAVLKSFDQAVDFILRLPAKN